MTPRTRILSSSISAFVAVSAAVSLPAARAADLFWGPAGAGGAGTWIDDATTANWFDGTNSAPWLPSSTAVFGGTAGAVTVSGAIAGVNGMTFNTTGYALTGGTLTITGPTVTLGSGIAASIASTLAGTAGLSVTGGGNLTLTSLTNTLTGTYTVGTGSTLTAAGEVFSTTGNNAVIDGTLNLSNGAPAGSGRYINALTGSGVITSTASTAGASIRVKSGDFSGSIQDGGSTAKRTSLLFEATAGVLSLSGNNTYTGDTLIRNAGTLRLSSATALPGSSLLRFAGGTLELNSGDLTKTVGTAVGSGNFALEAGTNYLAALGADRTVNLGAAQIVWGTTAGFAGGAALGFGSANATHKLTFSTPLSFGNVARTIDVPNGAAAVEGEFTGNITSGGTTGALTKTGAGTLQFSGTNTITGIRLKAGTTIFQGGSNTGGAFSSIGVAAGDDATLILNGNATNNAGNFDFNLGDVGTARGRMDLNSTGTTTTGILYVGKGTGSVGVLNLNSGTLTSVNGGESRIGGGAAANTTAYGIVNQTGGTINYTAGGGFQVGAYGLGVMNMSGGVANLAGWVDAARFNTGVGVINVSGGNFNQTNAARRLFAGEDGTGVINITGGAITATGGIVIGNTATANGVFNVLGGVTTTQLIVRNGGAGALYLNGGTLRPVAANATFLQNLTTATVGPNGALFDTNGFDITVSQPLLAPAGSGVTTIPVTTGGAGYVGNPIVSITGGGGTGATGVANLTNGVVTSVTITNPGNGYTGMPTVALLGGGASSVATLGTPTTAANLATGGLSKSGAGVLTLAAANTYAGPTTITGGTVAFTGAADGGLPGPLGASSNAASNLIFDGGALRLTGLSGSTDRNFTINSGKTAVIDVATAGGVLVLNGGSAATNGALTKTGLGTVVFGTANLHTGVTTAAGGVIAASGMQSGAFAVNGGRLAPGYLAEATLTVPTLTFGTTGGVDFEFGGGTNDVIAITNPGGLTLGTATLNLFQTGGTAAFTESGTYPLFDYSGTFGGTLAGAFTIANSQPGKVYSINNNTGATRIDLVINDGTVSAWAVDGSGSWNVAGNWTPSGVPNAVGAAVTFGSALTGANAPAAVALDGPKTVGTIAFDNVASYNVTAGSGGTLTVDNGIGVAQIAANVGAHTISAPVALTNATNLSAAAASSLKLSGPLSGGQPITASGAGNIILSGNVTGAPTITMNGTGSLILSGSNTLGGAATINSGTLEVTGANALGGLTSIVEKNGAVLRVASGGTVTLPAVTLDLAGGTATAVSGLANGNGNFAVDVTAGTTANVAGLVTAPTGGTFVKRGPGTLRLSNGGANTLASGVATIAAVVQDGSLVFDGGASATYAIAGGELTIGDNTPNAANATLSSGTLNVGTFISVSRGNGTTGLASALNVTGGTVNTANLYSGFANGVAGYNTAPQINLSGSSTVNVSFTGLGIRLSESAGAFTTATLADTATLFATGHIGIGDNGRALVKIGAGATLNVFQARFGTAANGAGAIWNRGNVTVRSTAAIEHFPLGFAVGAYGYYLHDSASPLTVQEVGVGGSGAGTTGGGSGVMEVRSGVVNVANWLTVNRTGGASATSGTVLVQGGTLNVNNAADRFYLNQPVAAALAGLIDVGAGGRLNGGNLTNINLQNNNVVGGEASQGTLTVHDGGIVEAARIFAATANGQAVVNLSGGTLIAKAAGALLDNNLDAVVLHAGGGTINTNGFNVTNANNLAAPAGDGLSSIPVTTAGSGYIGRPIVRIEGGGGSGASAVASFNEVTGELTGIAITSPGTGYTSAPTITLVGGGATTPATLGTIGLGANVQTGGLTKAGAGTLTLSGANSYAGPTVITAGTLAVTGSISASSSIDVKSGAILDVTGGGGFTLGATQTLTGGGSVNGAVAVTGTVAPGNGAGTLTSNGAMAFISNSTLALEIMSASSFDQLVAADVSLGSTVNLTIALGYTPVGGQSFLVVDNLGASALAQNFSFGGNQLSEGEQFTVGSSQFAISYVSGAGSNDVTLTVVPEPTSAVMLLAGLGAFAGMQRMRRRLPAE